MPGFFQILNPQHLAGPIPQQGLRLRQVYDETTYIRSSVKLVQQNIWIGGALAAFILMLIACAAAPGHPNTSPVPGTRDIVSEPAPAGQKTKSETRTGGGAMRIAKRRAMICA